MEKRHISLNRGHFSLDTTERSKDFSRKLLEGWEDEYQEYRRLWIDLQKSR